MAVLHSGPRELTCARGVADACGGDDLLVWAARGMRPGVRAWALGDALVVASPAAARRDRLAVWGSPRQVIRLVRHALAEMGPTYRPFGDPALVRETVSAVDADRGVADFFWMATSTLSPTGTRSVAAAAVGTAAVGTAATGAPSAAEVSPRAGDAPGGGDSGLRVCWLGPGEELEVGALLREAHPESYAVPGIPGVRRWAGVRDASGALMAVAADAWSAPAIGLMAGVATAVPARGHGLGERVCRFVTEGLLASYGRAALMADDDNDSAMALYERLGYIRRPVAAARVH